jgi:hypothetical protein
VAFWVRIEVRVSVKKSRIYIIVAAMVLSLITAAYEITTSEKFVVSQLVTWLSFVAFMGFMLWLELKKNIRQDKENL